MKSLSHQTSAEETFQAAFGSLRRTVTEDHLSPSATSTERSTTQNGEGESTSNTEESEEPGPPPPTRPRTATVGGRRRRGGAAKRDAGEWLLAFSVRNRLLKSLSLHAGCSTAALASTSASSQWRGYRMVGDLGPFLPDRLDSKLGFGPLGPGHEVGPKEFKLESKSRVLNRAMSGGDSVQLLRMQHFPPRRSLSYLFYSEVM